MLRLHIREVIINAGHSAREKQRSWQKGADIRRHSLVIPGSHALLKLLSYTQAVCNKLEDVCCVCSNVLPMHVDLSKDYFTESSRSALKAVFASWSLDECRDW